MSQINSSLVDYIHLRYENYKEHGNKKQGGASDWHSQRIAIYGKIARNKSTANLEEIENMFNAIRRANSEDDNLYSQAKKMVNDRMYEKFGKELNMLNYETMTVEQAQQPLGIALAKVKTKGRGSKTHFTEIRKLTETINSLEQAVVNSLTQTPDNAELISLKTQIEHIKRLYQLVFKKTVQDMESSGWTLPAGRKSANHAKDVRALRDAVNNIIDLYAKIEPVKSQEGYLLEAVLAACNWTGHSLALGAATSPEIFEKSITGGGKVTVVRPELSNNGSVVETLDKVTLNIASQKTSTHTSKVDVVIDYMEGKPTRISAKNVYIKDNKTWINVVDNGNLVHLLESMDLDFVKHYLNTYNTHTLYNGKSQKPKDNNLVQEMKSYIFYKAIAGDRGEDTVNVIAVHNKATGEVKLFHLGEVISALKDNKKISVKINDINITKFYFKNIYNEDGVRFRLGEMLNQIHHAKVSASFNAGALKSLIKK